ATASIDGTAKVWDAATGKEVYAFRGHVIPLPFAPRVPVTCLAFSPDGKSVASGSLSPNLAEVTNPRKAFGVVKVWEAATAREPAAYGRQVGVVMSLAFSPDGGRIASSYINAEKSFAVWDARTGKEIHVVRGNASHVHRLRYSPDGRLLAAGHTDGSVTLWDATSLAPVRTFDAHPAPVYTLAFSPDGAR